MAPYSSHANVTATGSLTTRLAINQKYGAFDFHEWVLSHLAFRPGLDILDVGCGTGVHAIKALGIMNNTGSVSAMDLSVDSIAVLRENASAYHNLEATAGDMGDLDRIIHEKFHHQSYDLAYSVYALWYARDHFGVLDTMRKFLRPGGRLLICTPNAPNGLRELLKRLGQPRPELDQVTEFGPNVLEPYFRAYFDDVSISLRRNLLRITEIGDAIEFYRSTGYHDPSVEPRLKAQVELEIGLNGFFAFEKNNYLISGSVSRG